METSTMQAETKCDDQHHLPTLVPSGGGNAVLLPNLPKIQSAVQLPPISSLVSFPPPQGSQLVESPTDNYHWRSASHSSTEGVSYGGVPAPLVAGPSAEDATTLSREFLSGSRFKVGKPVSEHKEDRKKKECPTCGKMFANLSTHAATHLLPMERPFKCEVCSRGFARANDLIRHNKRHYKDDLLQSTVSGETPNSSEVLAGLKDTFKCPYNAQLVRLDLDLHHSQGTVDMDQYTNCHTTGIFSRCDTFKNHLKALHFEYPLGTKKKDRAFVAGKCKHCNERFESVDQWLSEHVEQHKCGYVYK